MGRVLAFRRAGVSSPALARSPLSRLAARVAWIVAPVLLAGLGQVVVLKTGFLASLAVPIDAGLRWRGKPVLGPRKTWRGVVVMSMLSALVAGAQALAARRSARLRALSPCWTLHLRARAIDGAPFSTLSTSQTRWPAASSRSGSFTSRAGWRQASRSPPASPCTLESTS